MYAYLADQHWYRRVSTQEQITLGGYRYGLGTAWRQQEVELTCDAPTQEFYCYAADGQLIKRLAIPGLDKADLMGELSKSVKVS